MINFLSICPEIVTLKLFGNHFSLSWYAVFCPASFFLAFTIMQILVLRVRSWKFNIPAMEVEQLEAILAT